MPRKSDSLSAYREKRDTRRSGEPAGSRGRSHREPRFVVQHHLARSDHYDFRLEVDGVLRSWAVPKGPSTDPGDKRMARPTEDHPLGYANFEGVIPAGEYGAGHASFELIGEKLTGGFALTRMRTGKNETWLLVKKSGDKATRPQIRKLDKSALCGQTLDQIEAVAARNGKSKKKQRSDAG